MEFFILYDYYFDFVFFFFLEFINEIDVYIFVVFGEKCVIIVDYYLVV